MSLKNSFFESFLWKAIWCYLTSFGSLELKLRRRHFIFKLKMKKNYIEFIYNKTTRKPRRLENNVFVSYLPERIKLQPGEIKSINMKIKLRLPNNLVGACTLLPSLLNNNIKLLNSFPVAIDWVIASQNHAIGLPYVFALKIQNENMNITIQLGKKKNLDSLGSIH